MSIDYRANFGIGYKVSESEEIFDTEELEDGLLDYLWNEAGDNFDSFETGNGFSGDSDGVYLVIKNPFENGLDLVKAKEKLDAEAKRLKLEINSEFDVVGGLYVS